jgi:RNA polymerase sigma-70 factor (ECF subfamily)
MTASAELTQLLARCAFKDRQAFECLYRQTSGQLFGLVLRIVKQRETASEVLQEAYIKIWHHAGDFRPAQAKPLTWMGAIVRNQAIDWLRRRAHQSHDPEPVEALHWLADEAAGPEEIVSQAQEQRTLHDCLEQLEGGQRQAMMLAYFNGLTHEELAQRLSTPLGTVKSWLRRGLLRLKKCLDES